MSEKYHYKYLDLIRTIGVFLVMYGHLVTVAMYSPTIDVVISEDNNYMLPMLDSTKPAIDSLEILFGKFGGGANSSCWRCDFFYANRIFVSRFIKTIWGERIYKK